MHDAVAERSVSVPGYDVSLPVVPPTRADRRRRPDAVEVFAFLVGPIVLLLIFTALFRWTQFDLTISGLFYSATELRWPYHDAEPWLTLYHYGPYPGLIMGIAGLVVGVASYVFKAMRPWREMGLFLGLLLALGPGLAVNGILKPAWSRPRPNQVEAFGGAHEFISVWGMGPQGSSKSFPCGHASIGFYLMAPAFLLYRRRPRWALAFLLVGLSGGGVLGLARVAQGQHFLSDVLWSAGLVYLCGVVLSYLFFRTPATEVDDGAGGTRPHILTLEGKSKDEPSVGDTRDGARRRAA